MKTKLLFFAFCISAFSYAQNIVFQDSIFKNTLLQSKIDYNDQNSTVFIDYPPIDANNDNEISVQEALSVNRLNLYYSEITNLSGLENFSNIKGFESSFYSAGDFNFPQLTSLESITISNALTGIVNISNLNLSSNTNLKNILINSSAVTVNLDNLVNLKNLSLGGSFSQIDISDCVNLLNLTIDAPLENLNLNVNTKLISINITNANFTTLDLSSCTNLEVVNISNTELETFDLGDLQYVYYLFVNDNKLTSIDASKLFNLKFLNAQNNLLTQLSLKNGIIEESLQLAGNPTLETICCDANEIVYLQNICNTFDYTATVSDCDLVEEESRVSLEMYPNPMKDRLHIDCNQEINKIELFGSNGLLVSNIDVDSEIVDVSALQNGIYFVKVTTKSDSKVMKLVKGN